MLIIGIWTWQSWQQTAVWKDSRTLMATSAAREPGSPFVHDALAGELLADGDVDGAIAASRTAIAAGGKAPQYRQRLAQALIVGGQLVQAETELRDVIARDADAANAWFALSVVLRRLDRRDEAVQALTTAGLAAERTGDDVLARRVAQILAAQVR